MPFGERAAVELAAMTRDALAKGGFRAGTNATRAKLKFDRQIVAIARVERVSTIHSDDEDIMKLASGMGMTVVPILELAPPHPSQSKLELPVKIADRHMDRKNENEQVRGATA